MEAPSFWTQYGISIPAQWPKGGVEGLGSLHTLKNSSPGIFMEGLGDLHTPRSRRNTGCQTQEKKQRKKKPTRNSINYKSSVYLALSYTSQIENTSKQVTSSERQQ